MIEWTKPRHDVLRRVAEGKVQRDMGGSWCVTRRKWSASVIRIVDEMLTAKLVATSGWSLTLTNTGRAMLTEWNKPRYGVDVTHASTHQN